ncbi:MAG: (Fe-S)-binding protein, partial [Thiobacillaceae bacterium]|nr:(Fe-S)-binding protein [Thiobacillaceae bacterium]
MSHLKSFVAAETSQSYLGYPHQLPADWKERALDRMGQVLEKFRSVRVFMDACVHCGACTDKCHYFLGTADPNNMPVARQELMRKVYRRYFTLPGKIAPWLVGAEDL